MKVHGMLPCSDAVKDIYEMTPVGCGMRRMGLAALMYGFQEKVHETDRACHVHTLFQQVPELGLDFLTLLQTLNNGEHPNPLLDPPCTYHQHGDNKQCYLMARNSD